jgi:iron transport multicopper oxidase
MYPQSHALFQNAGQFQINGHPFTSPDVPVLLQILNGVPAQNLLPSGSVISLPPNRVVQVTLPARNVSAIGGPHPFHVSVYFVLSTSPADHLCSCMGTLSQ